VYEENHDETDMWSLGQFVRDCSIDALEKMPNFGGPQYLKRYLVKDGTKAEGDHKMKGTISIGGQEHFYMEPHNVIVVPIGEKDEYVCHVGTQEPDFVQSRLAMVLDVPKHKITVKTKRIGGGFGGKERLEAILITNTVKYVTYTEDYGY